MLANVAFLNAATVDAGVFPPAPAAAGDTAEDGGFADIFALLTQAPTAETETGTVAAETFADGNSVAEEGDGGSALPGPAALVTSGIDAAMLMLTERAAGSTVLPDGADTDTDTNTNTNTDTDADASAAGAASAPSGEDPNDDPSVDSDPPRPANVPDEAKSDGDRNAFSVFAFLSATASSLALPQTGEPETVEAAASATAENSETDAPQAEDAPPAAGNDGVKNGSGVLSAPLPPQTGDAKDDDAGNASASPVPPAATGKDAPATSAAGTAPSREDETDNDKTDNGDIDDKGTGDAGNGLNASASSPVPVAVVTGAVQPAAPAPANVSAERGSGDTTLAVTDVGTAPARSQKTVSAASAQTADGGRTTDTDSAGSFPDIPQGFNDALKSETETDATDDAPAKSAKTTTDAKTASPSPAAPATGDAGTAAQTAAPAADVASSAVAAVPAQAPAAGAAAVKPAVRIAVSASADDDATTNLQSLGLTIAAKSASGAKHFEIGLNPPDLGRIDVKLSVGDDGSVKAALTADKPQTLALLQNDAANLVRSLNEAGLTLHQNALSFSLGGGGDGGQNNGHASYSGGNLAAEAVVDSETSASAVPAFFSDGIRLDIRV